MLGASAYNSVAGTALLGRVVCAARPNLRTRGAGDRTGADGCKVRRLGPHLSWTPIRPMVVSVGLSGAERSFVANSASAAFEYPGAEPLHEQDSEVHRCFGFILGLLTGEHSASVPGIMVFHKELAHTD